MFLEFCLQDFFFFSTSTNTFKWPNIYNKTSALPKRKRKIHSKWTTNLFLILITLFINVLRFYMLTNLRSIYNSSGDHEKTTFLNFSLYLHHLKNICYSQRKKKVLIYPTTYTHTQTCI